MICTSCGLDKENEEFSWRDKEKGVLHKRCKICTRSVVKKHYLSNKDKYKSTARINTKSYIERNQKFIMDYLDNHFCIDCGEKDIVVLDFDHREDKNYNISRMVLDGVSLGLLRNEVGKCDIRCSNCHRRKTAKERGYYKLRDY